MDFNIEKKKLIDEFFTIEDRWDSPSISFFGDFHYVEFWTRLTVGDSIGREYPCKSDFRFDGISITEQLILEEKGIISEDREIRKYQLLDRYLSDYLSKKHPVTFCKKELFLNFPELSNIEISNVLVLTSATYAPFILNKRYLGKEDKVVIEKIKKFITDYKDL